MRAVMLEVPQALLDERRARGADRWDEMWEGDDYKVPDQVYARPELRSQRGIEGAASLVVEILSPNDETYQKLDWYARVGVVEVLVIDPETGEVELFANRDDRMVPVVPVFIECLGVRAETVDGKLRLTWEGGSADV